MYFLYILQEQQKKNGVTKDLNNEVKYIEFFFDLVSNNKISHSKYVLCEQKTCIQFLKKV